MTVALGGHNLNTNNDINLVTLQSKEFYIHPKYCSKTFPDDIALIKLPVSVAFTGKSGTLYSIVWIIHNLSFKFGFTARIRPVVLADLGNRDHVNDTVIVSGWGYYSDGDLIHFWWVYLFIFNLFVFFQLLNRLAMYYSKLLRLSFPTKSAVKLGVAW